MPALAAGVRLRASSAGGQPPRELGHSQAGLAHSPLSLNDSMAPLQPALGKASNPTLPFQTVTQTRAFTDQAVRGMAVFIPPVTFSSEMPDLVLVLHPQSTVM